MDAGKKSWDNPHPRASSNWLSSLTFWWTLKTFILGYSRDIEVEDLYNPLKEHNSGHVGDLLTKNWKLQLEHSMKGKRNTPSFFKAMLRTFGPRFMGYGLILLVLEMVVKVAQPIFLGRLIRYFSPGSGISLGEAYGYAVGVLLSSGLTTLIIHPFMMAVMHIGMQMRVASCSLIYRKALKLSHIAMGQTTAGQVVNLLSNDVNRFDIVPIFVHYMWIAPLQTILVAVLMWEELGWPSLVGIVFLLLTIPLQGIMGKKVSALRLRTAVRTDERVRLMNEIIGGIQVIKMYTWEKPFIKLVALARRLEIKEIRVASFIRAIFVSFMMFITRLSIFLSIIAIALADNGITAEKVFVISSYYGIVRQTMTIFFPQGIAQIAEGSISIKRIQEFLLLEEISSIQDNPTEESVDSKADEEKGVILRNVTGQWSPESPEPTLSKVKLRVIPGQLVTVIGPVGAGKSTLIHAVLGELPLSSGNLQVRGKVSYAAQEPWLFVGSVRQNITFGQPWDSVRYRDVIKVCALDRDLSQLPYGDRTIVGERGVSLSGGQRARVNLARAVYKEADIYLLDDPLSAVDAHVGRHLFIQCIKGFLRSKAVLLITHQLQFLSQADHILILKHGYVEAQGSHSKLQASGLDFAELLAGGEDELEALDGRPRTRSRTFSTNSQMDNLRITSTDEMRKDSLRKISKQIELTQVPAEVAEMRTSGTVSGKVYGQYLNAGGGCVTQIVLLAGFLVAQVVGSLGDYWMGYWSNYEEQKNSIPVIREVEPSMSWLNTDLAMGIYSALIVGLIVLSLARAFLFFNVCMRSSVNLHDSMFNSITRATMYFFNTNSSGRILNRFSKDMGSIDEVLPMCMIDATQIGLSLLGIIVVVAIVNYWLMIPTVIIGVIFYLQRVVYLSTSRSVKRLEGITRSPVFSHLNASLQGLTTIRAFEAEPILINQFDNHQDLHSSAWYLFIATNRAFGFWLDIVCFVYLAIVTLSFLVIGGNKYGGDVGLAITQAIALTGMFQWGMRQSAELENQMTSVERVLEFTGLESEPPLETAPENEPPEGWPQRGEILYKKLSLRYSPSEPIVLKEIDLTIYPEEKLGIVGRTGAGKSSLISALFRLAEQSSGCLKIDGVDTSSVGLHRLRASISIIPQEPVLFSGTMRKNLDPFDEYPDDVIWTALEEVELHEAVSELEGGLSSHMSEGGHNLSVGQRQLVCLARAIVRNNRILVMDEATANVDPNTDILIQSTIRRKFSHCTVLTIAHRLHTIMDSDRVLVMDAGRVAELGSPAHLLADPTSMLSRMADQTGHSTAAMLRDRAYHYARQSSTFSFTLDQSNNVR